MPKSLHRPEAQVLLELLRDYRVAAGLTQDELSLRLERAQSFVSDVERGQRRLDLVQLRDYAHALGHSLGDLVVDFERRAEKLPRSLRR